MRGPWRSSRTATASRRLPGDLAELLDPARANLGRAVRGVDADDVDPGIDQGGHPRGVVPRGAEGGDDLGAANGSARHGREFNAGPSPLHHDLAAHHGEARPARANRVAGAALDGGVERPRHQIGVGPGASRPGALRAPAACAAPTV